MKKNREVLKSEIRLKSEKDNIRRGVSKGNVILVGFVCLLIGFIPGATVRISKTSRETEVATPAGEPKQSGSVDNEREVQLAKSILGKDPNNLQVLISLGNAHL